VPLAWSLARCTGAQWRQLALCVLSAGAAGILALVISYLARPHGTLTATARVLEGLRSFALYLPVCFMIEEVFFRGGLDSYLTRGGTRAPWLSAFYLSALWGWWHLPIVTLQPEHRVAQLGALVLALPLVHCGVGALLSFFWRRSGLLLVPVCAHAFIDAVRNALQ
jgi:membrane protease YdiL (CAAX protease family)